MSNDAPLRELPLTVNGEPLSVPQRCTVEQLIARIGADRRRIAVAINRSVVPRSTFATQELSAGDRIEILEAVGGG